MGTATTATLCPACGRTTVTSGRGRCVHCAHFKVVRAEPGHLAPRETWGDLARLAGRKALRIALLALPVAVLAAFVLAAFAVDVLTAFALTIAFLLVAAALGAMLQP